MKKEFLRKLIHFSSIIYPILYLFYLEKPQMMVLTGGILAFLLIVDLLRIFHPSFRTLCNKFFAIFSRKEELSGQIYGSTYFILGAFLSIAIFEKNVAVASILTLILADGLAAIFGKLIKSPKLYGEKTVSGFVCFLIVTFCISLPWFGVLNALILAFSCALLELFAKKLKLDDNLLIPLAYGGILTILNLL